MAKKIKIPIGNIALRLGNKMDFDVSIEQVRWLLSGWCKHPKFLSPNRETFRHREKKDGFIWFKQEELPSFSAYCGYDLM